MSQQQRPIMNKELQEKRNSQARSLKEYQQGLPLNYQEYVSQASEQYTNDFESLSRPSVKSMPVRMELLKKYKEQLDMQPKFQILPKPKQQVEIKNESGHQQSVSSMQSEPPKNPFEETRKKEEVSFSKVKESQIEEQISNNDEGQKLPFDNSSVMQYTQTQLLDQFGKTNQMSNFTSNQSNQSQEKSLDSEQFYDTIEEQGQFAGKVSTGCQKFDHHYQSSSRTYNSIKEEIRDDSSITHSSHQEAREQPYLQSNQSPVYESIDQESQLVENTQRWSQMQTIPQNTAQFQPFQPVIEVKQEYNNSQLTKQETSNNDITSSVGGQHQQQSSLTYSLQKDGMTNPIIFKKLSQELVVDAEKFGNSKLLKSINKTQLLFLAEKYVEQQTLQLLKSLHTEFKLFKKVQELIWAKQTIIQTKCFKQFKVNRERQLEKQEKERIGRQFRFQRTQILKKEILYALKQNLVQGKNFIMAVKKTLTNYKLKILITKWKSKVYDTKMKKQMDLQYKQFLFTGWLTVAKREIKYKDAKALTKYYFTKLKKYYNSWKKFTKESQIMKVKYFNAYCAVNQLRKKYYLTQWVDFVDQRKRDKEFEAYAKQANEYVPVKVNLKTQNIKIYNLK